MKSLITLLFSSFFLISCSSDKLTNNEAEDLLNMCLKENVNYRTMFYGNVKISKKDTKTITFYQKLEASGFLALEEVNESKYSLNYNIKLKEKIKEYVSNLEQYTDNKIDIQRKLNIKTYHESVKEIVSIHEIPNENIANVEFECKITNPIIDIYNSIKIKNNERKAVLIKTNDGWRYKCPKKNNTKRDLDNSINKLFKGF
ncbi:hypothetical protein [uncultured Lacinutrix sp.]|uniref:hypothetical protein n=1 Tax=uncultured Lacinutrix sp. TaxID=574032 RepID=UPI002626538C|nr:hypothetical protein [uncultured Lacinutrix sp.]